MVSAKQRAVESDQKNKGAKRLFYKVQFREKAPTYTVLSQLSGLTAQTVVMVRSDHGLEPAQVVSIAPISFFDVAVPESIMEIVTLATKEECIDYLALQDLEKNAFVTCKEFVEKHQLRMKLVRVQCYFDGSKMIFYFTAENRVDFRELVKDLVQEYRTRIEMRQIGVRHETKMLGGLGFCGREFCCSTYVDNFSSVSIKMAKEQDLPLNPNKISGVCNRLFCCLTHEYDGYRKARRLMPKPGRKIVIGQKQFIVRQHNVLRRQVIVENSAGEEIVLEEQEWLKAKQIKERGERRK